MKLFGLNANKITGGRFVCCGGLLCFVALAYVSPGRAMQGTGAPPEGSPIHGRSKGRLATLKQAESLRAQSAGGPGPKIPSQTSASNSLATPAIVVLKNGALEVQANDSDLQQILKRIAAVSGMIIDGPIANSRVYGVFGPQDPRDVLNELLVGSGYNYMMIGVTQEGTPRELRLTPQNGKATPAVMPSSVATDRPEPEVSGPGAVIHVPPQPSEDPQERVRQNLKRLQQMHDSQPPQPQ
jgi:hypothetical protein